MAFKVGDTVSVMDENISGIVTEVEGEKVFIESTDGFVMEFSAKELLKISPKDSLKSELFSNHSLQSVLSEKERPTRNNIPKIKHKERSQPKMEVDLHIHQLTTKDRHMGNHDKLTLQLDTAKRQLEFAISKRIQKIVFIHGVGQGVLRAELEYLVKRYDNVKYYDADYQKYGVGAMEVYIYQNVNNS